MTARHNPGPWAWSKDSMREGRYSIYHNGPIAYCGDTSNVPGDGEANARLIASAPALLAALDSLVGILGNAEDELSHDQIQALETGRAAMDAARGGEGGRDA